MTSSYPSPLQAFAQHEQERPDAAFLTQSWHGQYQDITWQQAGQMARRLAYYLQQQGLEPGARVAIMSKNSAYWVISDLAIWMAGMVSVPLYPSLTAQSVRPILEHSEVQAVIYGQLDVPGVRAGIPDSVLTIATPLCLDASGCTTWEQAMQSPELATQEQAPEQLATIMYTSGTTGLPKGAMHSFGNMATAASSYSVQSGLSKNDVIFSYLPMSHVGERLAVELTALYCGSRIFFNESLDSFISDLRTCKPDVFLGVPRIWLKLFQAMRAFADAELIAELDSGREPTEAEAQGILASVGLEKARFGVCGAAPVPPSLLNWYNRLGLPMIEVYGMTENFGYSHLGQVGITPAGWVGPSLPGVEVRLTPEGEVAVNSPANMLGYYKDEAKSAEVFTNDGYFLTGDKGKINEQGLLRIVGRVRDTFKTSKGKFVAPAPIENALASSPWVEHVLVLGQGLPAPVALIVQPQQLLNQLDDALLTQLETLRLKVNTTLERHEQISHVLVIAEQWGVASGELTPTLKAKRDVLEHRYAEALEQLIERAPGAHYATSPTALLPAE